MVVLNHLRLNFARHLWIFVKLVLGLELLRHKLLLFLIFLLLLLFYIFDLFHRIFIDILLRLYLFFLLELLLFLLNFLSPRFIKVQILLNFLLKFLQFHYLFVQEIFLFFERMTILPINVI